MLHTPEPLPQAINPFLGLEEGLIQGTLGCFLPYSLSVVSFQLHVAAVGPWKCQILLSWPSLILQALGPQMTVSSAQKEQTLCLLPCPLLTPKAYAPPCSLQELPQPPFNTEL